METVFESNDYCNGITSINNNLYLCLNDEVYCWINGSLIKSGDNIIFPDTKCYTDWIYDENGYLHINGLRIEIGAPFHYLTANQGYIYGHFGIDGLCLTRLKIPNLQ